MPNHHDDSEENDQQGEASFASREFARQLLRGVNDTNKKLDKLIDAVGDQGKELARLMEFRIATEKAQKELVAADVANAAEAKKANDQILEWRGSLRVVGGLLALGELVLAAAEVYAMMHGGGK